MWLYIPIALGQTPCPEPPTLHLDRAEAAYFERDRSRLVRAIKAAQKAFACEPGPRTAARIHVSWALADVLDADWSAAREDLRAAVAAAPLEPLSNPLMRDQRFHLEWQRAQEQAITWHPSKKPTNGFDSTLAPDAPVLKVKGNGAAKR